MGNAQDTDELFAPRPTGKPPEEMSFTGLLLARDAQNDRPVLVGLTATTNLYLPCFQNKDDLDAVMEKVLKKQYTIKEIADGKRFLAVLPRELDGRKIKIVTNLRFMPNGSVRFTEVRWDL